MTKRYSRTLSSGANNTVIALSETEVGKIFTGDTRPDIGSEGFLIKPAATSSCGGLFFDFKPYFCTSSRRTGKTNH